MCCNNVNKLERDCPFVRTLVKMSIGPPSNQPLRQQTHIHVQVQAFIISGVDSGNALYYGITASLMTWWAASTRLVTGTRGNATAFHYFASCTGFQCDSVLSLRSPPSSTRRCLDMLPAKWLTTAASSPTLAQKRLRSAETSTLLVCRTRTNFGDSVFCATGPQVWNCVDGPQSQTAGFFIKPFQTVTEDIFGQWDQSAEWIPNLTSLRIFLTYLLIY